MNYLNINYVFWALLTLIVGFLLLNSNNETINDKEMVETPVINSTTSSLNSDQEKNTDKNYHKKRYHKKMFGHFHTVAAKRMAYKPYIY